jgi:predicted nucleic acid-binding protein
MLESSLMLEYFLDTNVLIDFGRNPKARAKLENAHQGGRTFLVAPPALIELVRGMVSRGYDRFASDKQVFVWLRTNHFGILELPRPFMARILHSSTPRPSGVEPRHYAEQIEMIAGSASFDEFLQRASAPGSVWRDISRADEIHCAQLNKEFLALERMAEQRRGPTLAQRLSQLFGAPGCRPKPLIIERQFSAAIEFLESSFSKVRAGAKPRKNDAGLYTDFQLLLYLAARDVNFLTCEDFSSEIRKSPQKARIVHPDSLP